MATLTLTPLSAGIINSDAPTITQDVTTGFFATGHFTTPQTNRSLLDFDLTQDLGSDFTISAATLQLTVQGNFLGTSHTLNLYRVRRRWRGNTSGVEAVSTWNNADSLLPVAWTTAGAGSTTTDRDSATIGTLSVTSATTGTVTITLDATKVAEWVSGAFLNFGLLLQASDETNTTLMRWYGPQDVTPANRPVLTLTYTASTHAVTESLLAYHSLDTTSYLDASGNGHVLTPHNTPTSVTGKLGNAAHCVAASTQWLSNSDAALKLGDVDWTWLGWVKLTDKLNFYTVASIGDSGATGAGGGFKLFYHKVTVLDYFVAQLYSTDVTSDPVIADIVGYTAGNPTAATWLFVCVRHDATRNWLHMAQDYGAGLKWDSASGHWLGQRYGPYDPTTIHGGPAAPATDYVIGRDAANGGQDYLNGDVDEIGFWSRWLSPAEIAAIRDSVIAGTSPVVLAQYAYPTSDVSAGAWRSNTGATTSLYSYVDEPTTPNDADYILSSPNPTSDQTELHLGTLPDPGVDTGHVLHIRRRQR